MDLITVALDSKVLQVSETFEVKFHFLIPEEIFLVKWGLDVKENEYFWDCYLNSCELMHLFS
jgi:hypothetical protein